MARNCICPDRKVYIAGPAFSSFERLQLARMSAIVKQSGYNTYIAHVDGLHINKVINKLLQEGKSLVVAKEQAADIIFQFNVFNLLKSDVIFASVNETEPDSGTVALMSIAFACCMPVILFKDSTRTETEFTEISPHLNSMKAVPLVRKLTDMPPILKKIFIKLECKCVSLAIKEISKKGAKIIAAKYR